MAALLTGAALWAQLSCVGVPALAAEESQEPSSVAAASRMNVEQEFAGPIANTMIHRWRDPTDGTVCYVYVPVPPRQYAISRASGFVRQVPDTIGSISCVSTLVAPGT